MHPQRTWLMGRAAGLLLIAIAAALIAAQWKHEALPLAAVGTILVLTIVKARIVVLDFMGLRDVRPGLARAIVAWPILFALLVAAKVAAQAFV